MKYNGFDPGPKRGYGSWAEFIERHFKTVWATDFFTKTVWTMRGPVTYYVLFFIHLHTRRVHIAGMTPNPDGDWMALAARNMSMIFSEEAPEFRPTHIIRDRDTKFTNQFCATLETDGIDFRPIPPRSPNLKDYDACFTSLGRRRETFGKRRRSRSFRPWLFIGISPVGGSYRHSFLSL